MIFIVILLIISAMIGINSAKAGFLPKLDSDIFNAFIQANAILLEFIFVSVPYLDNKSGGIKSTTLSSLNKLYQDFTILKGQIQDIINVSYEGEDEKREKLQKRLRSIEDSMKILESKKKTVSESFNTVQSLIRVMFKTTFSIFAFAIMLSMIGLWEILTTNMKYHLCFY